MKKILLLFLICVSSLNLSAQYKSDWVYNAIDISIGASITSKIGENGKNAIPITFGISIFNGYFEFGSTFTKGKGEPLAFQSSESYKTNKVNSDIYLLGWNFKVMQDKMLITPKLGLMESYAIYQDPVLYNTYYYSDKEKDFVAGVNLKYFFSDYFGITIGGGYNQLATIQFIMRLK